MKYALSLTAVLAVATTLVQQVASQAAELYTCPNTASLNSQQNDLMSFAPLLIPLAAFAKIGYEAYKVISAPDPTPTIFQQLTPRRPTAPQLPATDNLEPTHVNTAHPG